MNLLKQKIKCMFVASRQKTITALLGTGILFSVHIGRYNYGLPIPNGFCTVRSEIVFAERGIVQPFFCTSYFNHSYMAKTMKDCRQGDYSTPTATLPHVTGKSYYYQRAAGQKPGLRFHPFARTPVGVHSVFPYPEKQYRNRQKTDRSHSGAGNP